MGFDFAMEINIQHKIKTAKEYMKKKDFKNAVPYLQSILEYQKNLFNEALFIKVSRRYKQEKRTSDAIQVLENGLQFYPNSQKMNHELIKLILLTMKWNKAYHLVRNKQREIKGINVAKVYFQLGTAFIKLGQYNQAESILKEGIEKYPLNNQLSIEYAKIAIKKMNWSEAEDRWRSFCDSLSDKIPADVYLGRSITNQILGNNRFAESLFHEYLKKRENVHQQKDYKKVILYDNGESRIEFYKKLHPSNTVLLTFDSINMVWHEDPFGFKFLLNQGVDIIALRRRSKENNHQDLSREEYLQTVHSLVNTYKKKKAYGFSLGGYTSLYYGAGLNCEILSLSPRLPVHPFYGDTPISVTEFKHSLSHPKNPEITPHIIYDPKNRIDRRYVEEDLMVSYPNANLYKCPYAGHRTAPYFHQMGVLKELVKNFLNENELLTFDRKLRWKSHQYLRVLGSECLNRNKSNWALKLAEAALELEPNDERSAKLKRRLLKD
ncbi:hypothetical protein IEC97_10200 [Neobacillus cucumis]|uniref:tetratricopeptide repeat protein n=1 Tax=Neobacillus cucumis TaxID=1740721 RepID=UPI0018DEF9A1|nr:hypothetical protein [Neobacillus cucumis]MBI0577733.1 hypothetical protein [Neobacillus cucumis]